MRIPTISLLALGALVFLGVARVVDKWTENPKCPKCGGEMDFWDSRCKDLICKTEGCKGSIKLW